MGLINFNQEITIYQFIKLIIRSDWPEKVESVKLFDELKNLTKNFPSLDEDIQQVWAALSIQVKNQDLTEETIKKLLALPNAHVSYIYQALVSTAQEARAQSYFQLFSQKYSQDLQQKIKLLLETQNLHGQLEKLNLE